MKFAPSTTTCRLKGGLGNCLFQIAATWSLARENRSAAVFELGKGGLPHRRLNDYRNNILRKIEIGMPRKGPVYREPVRSGNYRPIPYVKNMCLDGYFQSERYFSNHKKDIANLFGISSELRSCIVNKYPLIVENHTVSVHIRRGDYLQIKGLPLVGKSYVFEALKFFTSPIVFVFSDEISWCRKNLSENFNYISEEDYIELYMMSLCKNNIIANSTFSWWGAWLNQNPAKKIIAPNNWFGGNRRAKDLIPLEWVRI